MLTLKMAVSPNTKTRVKMTKTDKTKEKSDKKLLIVAQEIKLAKILAGNNKSLRDRTLRKLMKWFEAREKQIRKCLKRDWGSIN